MARSKRRGGRRYLLELDGDAPVESVVRALLELLCATMLVRGYPRAGLGDAKSLERLPPDERNQWQALWAGLGALLDRNESSGR